MKAETGGKAVWSVLKDTVGRSLGPDEWNSIKVSQNSDQGAIMAGQRSLEMSSRSGYLSVLSFLNVVGNLWPKITDICTSICLFHFQRWRKLNVHIYFSSTSSYVEPQKHYNMCGVKFVLLWGHQVFSWWKVIDCHRDILNQRRCPSRSFSHVCGDVMCANISSRIHTMESAKLNMVHNSPKQEWSRAKITLLFTFPIATTFKEGWFPKMRMSQKWGMSNCASGFINAWLLKGHHLTFFFQQCSKLRLHALLPNGLLQDGLKIVSTMELLITFAYIIEFSNAVVILVLMFASVEMTSEGLGWP